MRDTTVQDRPFEERLLEMLLEAHEERQGRVTGRRRKASMRRRGVGALLAATLVVGGWVVASAVGGDDTIKVDAAAAIEDPQAVERELREAGIDAEVRAVPTDPSLRGKWFWLHFPPGVDIDPETFALLQSYVGALDMGWSAVQKRCPKGVGCERTPILELPQDVPGPIVLIAGRAPLPGEKGWDNIEGDNELAPTGALYCLRLEELSPAEAGRRLEDLGYRVDWRYAEGDPFWAPGGFPDSPPPGTGVVYAWFLGPNAVEVSVVPDELVDRVRDGVGTPVTAADRSLEWAPDC
jgi:hypothetical protein